MQVRGAEGISEFGGSPARRKQPIALLISIFYYTLPKVSGDL